MDEATAEQVDHYESSALTDRRKVALRLADALMTLPGSISPALRDQAHEHFSADELIELTLDVMKWNYQKVAVALGTDDEVTALWSGAGHWGSGWPAVSGHDSGHGTGRVDLPRAVTPR